MWSDLPHPHFPPDSEEELRVVYGDGGGGLAAEAAAEEAARAGRGGRPRYGFTQAGATQRQAPLPPPAAQQQQLQQQEANPASPGASAGRPGGSTQQQPLTIAQELQGVLDGLSQPNELPQQAQKAQQAQQLPPRQQSTEDEEPGAWRPRPRRSGPRRIAHTSPAIPASELPPPAGGGPASGGRRWARVQAAAAAAARSPVVAAKGAGVDRGGDAFFSVDQDLMQAHAQRQQQAAAAPGRRGQQGRAVQWGSPQAAAAGSGAQHTPLQPSQRGNPLAALLGSGGDGGGGGAAKPRAATTGGKVRGRHPIYGAPSAATPSASQGSQPFLPAQPGSAYLREQLGLQDAPATSPRQAAQRRHAPQQHSRFAIRDPAAAAAHAAAAAGQQAAAPVAVAAPAGLRQLTGEQPASALKQAFQPRPRRALPADEIVEEDADQEEERDAGQQDGAAWGQPHGELPQRQQQGQQQQQAAGGWRQQAQQQQAQQATDADAGWRELEQAAAADGYRTPGQPLRRPWLDADQQQQQQQQQAGGSAGPAAAPALPGTGGSDRSGRGAIGGPGPGGQAPPDSAGRASGSVGMSLQRRFIAQLQPVSSSVAAATMQQQRQRLAGAAGLYARMQALLAAEKAAQEASPAGGRGGEAGPRLTVLHKELEGSITKCLCRCDRVGEAALGAPEVVALFQSRTAQRVDTAPGSVVLLREPWRMMPLAGNAAPAVLCFAAAMG
ncbi:hypothetical protein ABPG75_000603 [Micractinium tetrahymenae]